MVNYERKGGERLMNKAVAGNMLDRIYEYVSCICANYDAKGGTMSKNAYTTNAS